MDIPVHRDIRLLFIAKLLVDFVRDIMSSIGLFWSRIPAANTVVAGLVLFALVLVVLYWRARRGRRHTVDLTVPQGNMVNIPTWKRSYDLEAQQPYRRRPYGFEDV